MTDFVVRRDRLWHRLVTACACGRTVNLPEDGLATHVCRCERLWEWDGDAIHMSTPKDWSGRGTVDHG